MTINDYYRRVGVEKEASSEEIKKAYRRLAMALHPDRNPDDPDCEERLKEIKEAYHVLRDEDRRRQYDVASRGGYDKWMSYERHRDEDLINALQVLFGGGFPRGGWECREGRGGRKRSCRRTTWNT